jgi:hypothetical protein
LGLTMITAAFENLNSSAQLTVSPILCRWPVGITSDRRPIGQQVLARGRDLRSNDGPRMLMGGDFAGPLLRNADKPSN